MKISKVDIFLGAAILGLVLTIFALFNADTLIHNYKMKHDQEYRYHYAIQTMCENYGFSYNAARD